MNQSVGEVMLQSTPFARRETRPDGKHTDHGGASIHSLRKKGDRTIKPLTDNVVMLQSTPFARRETQPSKLPVIFIPLQSTPFARRETDLRVAANQ